MHKNEPLVSWVRYRDVSLLAVGKFVYTSDDRFKVLHEADSDEWFLVIKSVRYDDEGVYECQINAQPTYVSYKYMLSVVEPRTEIVGERELFVDYASSINLTCLVISPDPPAYVFWRQDQKLVEVSEASRPLKHRGEDNLRIVFAQNHPRPGITQSSLLIQKANASHSGLFSCLPSNSESKSIRVHVLKVRALGRDTGLGSRSEAPSSPSARSIDWCMILILRQFTPHLPTPTNYHR
eukprot:snap_masked-scaffold30_size591359-processed-gene-3.1 protein:Tk12759 transcript:snap_masked-scaffold30_size591359-processed-gene-3.1-mRNA-1 annotation:"protein sidekick-1-like"